MNIIIIGLIAATLTTVSFVPQIIRNIRQRERMEDVSLGMYILFCSGILLWLIYGLLIKDIPLILANSVTFGLSSVVLILKLKYK